MIDTWGHAILRACWQGGLALLAVWIICSGIRRISPGIKCWLWRLGYLKFITAFLLIGSIGLPLLPSKPAAGPSQAIVKEERMPRLAPAAPVAEISRAKLPVADAAEAALPKEGAAKPREVVQGVESQKATVESPAKAALAQEM